MNFRHLPVKQLIVFEVVARSRTFAQAANSLFMTQSGVSQHIQELESYLGKRLVNRQTKENFLTEEGRYLSKEISRSFRGMQNAVSFIKTKHGELKIKSSRSFATRWLLPKLHLFTQQHPEIKPFLGLFAKDEMDSDSFAFDIIVIYGSGQWEGYEAIPIVGEYMAPLGQPGICPATLEELKSSILLHPSQDQHDWREWAGYFNIDLEITNGVVFETMYLALNAAMEGHGVAMGDLNLVQTELKSGILKVVFPLVYKTPYQYYLLTNTGDKNPLVNLFHQWIVAEIEKNRSDIDLWESWSQPLAARKPLAAR